MVAVVKSGHRLVAVQSQKGDAAVFFMLVARDDGV